MKIPTIKGIIDRRILINFTVDPDVVKRILPPPFKPRVFNGKAIAGICLIRLSQVRPKWLPAFLGTHSENGAHRIAVEWEENGKVKEGVYIPRRDTSSRFNATVGGQLFPGKHYLADFDVKEENGNYHVSFNSSDDTFISVDARTTDFLKKGSIFKKLSTASAFFKAGSTGYSPNGNKYDGLLLKTYNWLTMPLEVSNIRSSYFEDERIFPKGSVQFDDALLMTNIEHEWRALPRLFYRI